MAFIIYKLFYLCLQQLCTTHQYKISKDLPGTNTPAYLTRCPQFHVDERSLITLTSSSNVIFFILSTNKLELLSLANLLSLSSIGRQPLCLPYQYKTNQTGQPGTNNLAYFSVLSVTLKKFNIKAWCQYHKTFFMDIETDK